MDIPAPPPKPEREEEPPSRFRKRYRIVTTKNGLYRVESRVWWMPIWMGEVDDEDMADFEKYGDARIFIHTRKCEDAFKPEVMYEDA